MEQAILKEEAVDFLWFEYKKTPEFSGGMKEAIPPNHKIVVQREKIGLSGIYKKFIEDLRSEGNFKRILKNMTPSERLNQWKNMHKELFQLIYKSCGDFRRSDVRFGAPGEEELYKIPRYQELNGEMAKFVDQIEYCLAQTSAQLPVIYRNLAIVHYQFIRIHPFIDGNGRIARAITDQLAIYFDIPPAMGGFPRNDEERQEAYHKAIRACVDDPDCSDLALWIKGFIDIQLESIA